MKRTPEGRNGYMANCAKGREWATGHVGEWFSLSLPAGERRREIRQVRVLQLHANFALLEVQAEKRGTWRETVGYEVLADQAPARAVLRRPPQARALPCGCVAGGFDVALCPAGRDLWAKASVDPGARAAYVVHLRPAFLSKAG